MTTTIVGYEHTPDNDGWVTVLTTLARCAGLPTPVVR